MKIIIDTEKSKKAHLKALLSELENQKKRGCLSFEIETEKELKEIKTKELKNLKTK